MSLFECPFSYYARQSSHLIALSFSKESWTYKKCHHIIATWCAALKQVGIGSNHRVGFVSTSLFFEPIFLFALFRLQAIACPLSPRFPCGQLVKQLNSLMATHFFYPSSMQRFIPQLKQVALPFSSLLHVQQADMPNRYFFNKKNFATCLLTSGSSSTPKIACHSLSNHYYSALGSNAHLSLCPGARWLLSLPLYHISGIALLFRSFLAGATVSLTREKPHQAKTILNTRATHLSFVPTQLRRLLDTATHEELLKLQKQLKAILVGGSALSMTCYCESYMYGLPLFPSYGMTEMSSQISTQLTNNYLFSLGHPLPYREMIINDQNEICVRGKTLFLGYLKEKIHLSLDQNGYFSTGDLGVYSTKSGVKLLGRKDRLFISGGENIYPEEIEHYLKQLQGVTYARIEPKWDREFGMSPVAYVKSKKPLDRAELQEYLKTFLPIFKIPKIFYISLHQPRQ